MVISNGKFITESWPKDRKFLPRGMSKTGNGEANRMQAPGIGECPSPIFGGMRPNKPGGTRNRKAENIIEKRIWNCSLEQKRNKTVQTTIDAVVCDNTIASSTVFKYTVRGPNAAAVCGNTVLENIFQKFGIASQSKSIEVSETVPEIMYSVILLQMMANSEKEAVAILIEEAFLTARTFIVKDSGINRHGKCALVGDCRFRHQIWSNSDGRKLPATSLGKTFCRNGSGTPRVCSKEIAVAERIEAAGSSAGTKGSRKGLSHSDRFGHRRDVRDRFHQRNRRENLPPEKAYYR